MRMNLKDVYVHGLEGQDYFLAHFQFQVKERTPGNRCYNRHVAHIHSDAEDRTCIGNIDDRPVERIPGAGFDGVQRYQYIFGPYGSIDFS